MVKGLVFESDLKKQRQEIAMEYRRKMKALREKTSETARKVDAARTHAVMQTTPYIAKALGMSELLNITADRIDASEELRFRLEEGQDIAVLFEEYHIAAKAVGDYLFNNPDVVEMIMEYVNKELVQNGKQQIGIKPDEK